MDGVAMADLGAWRLRVAVAAVNLAVAALISAHEHSAWQSMPCFSACRSRCGSHSFAVMAFSLCKTVLACNSCCKNSQFECLMRRIH